MKAQNLIGATVVGVRYDKNAIERSAGDVNMVVLRLVGGTTIKMRMSEYHRGHKNDHGEPMIPPAVEYINVK